MELIYPDSVKEKWAKEFLSPGLAKLTYNKDLVFTSGEWITFFDWAQTDRYDKITKYIKNGKS